MRAALRTLVLLALGVLGAAAVHAQQPAVDAWLMQRDPGAGTDLATGDGLHARLGYKSDRPVRFRMEAHAQGKAVTAGVMYGGAPLYPAGEGEAIVWIAYRQPTAIDEIAITALDADWKPVASIRTAVQLGWSTGIARRQPAAWVMRLNEAQQDMASQHASEDDSSDTFIFLTLMLGVLGYLVLQPLTVMRFEGAWRIAALAPLAATVPLLLQALLALTAGANLWPLLLILCLPIAALYLLAVAGMRALVRETAA